MRDAYLETLRLMLKSIDLAILEAKAELPDEVRWEEERIRASRQIVSTWRATREGYQGTDAQVMRALDLLCLLLDCAAKFEGLYQEATLPPPNLTLSRHR
jgi:hypothetical protein